MSTERANPDFFIASEELIEQSQREGRVYEQFDAVEGETETAAEPAITVQIPRMPLSNAINPTKKRIPDHFLSLRLAPEPFRTFRTFVETDFPQFSRFLVLEPSMHFTLGLLELRNDPERKERAIQTFAECREVGAIVKRRRLVQGGSKAAIFHPQTAQQLKAFRIGINGLGHFGNKVIFAKPENGEAHDRLLRLAGELLGHALWFLVLEVDHYESTFLPRRTSSPIRSGGSSGAGRT